MIIRQLLFLRHYFCSIEKGPSKNRTRTRTQDMRKNGHTKNGPVWKTGPQGVKMLPVVSCHMKGKVIHFHIKFRGVQGLVFVQITFEKCTTKFYLENGEVCIKNNLQFAVLITIKRFCMFLHCYTSSFSIKTCFYETSNAFYLEC